MFCRLHSPKKRATSDVDFPNRRNGMKMVVGSKERPAMETMPAVHIYGTTKVAEMNKAVVKQHKLLKTM